MSLTGFIRNTARKNGGIRKLGLICADEITMIAFGTSRISSLQLKDGSKFATYDFREDEAEYRETVSFAHGAYTVQHELKFLLDKMDMNSYRAFKDLIENSSKGFVAAIVSPNDDCHIIGYSNEFKAERPLRVTSIVGTSGKNLKDGSSEIITLQSTDVSKAYTVTDYEELFNR